MSLAGGHRCSYASLASSSSYSSSIPSSRGHLRCLAGFLSRNTRRADAGRVNVHVDNVDGDLLGVLCDLKTAQELASRPTTWSLFLQPRAAYSIVTFPSNVKSERFGSSVRS